LTVADDDEFLAVLSREANLPPGLAAGVADLYGA